MALTWRYDAEVITTRARSRVQTHHRASPAAESDFPTLWPLRTVLKFLSADRQRLLLADEVGLGKTIEAGIVLTELEARLGGLSRALIVCPSMLTTKWETEMRRHFGQLFQILTSAEFEGFLDRYVQYGEVERIKCICSLQSVRRERILDRLREAEPRFDLVIVDEAHHMRNPETLSSDLGELLSSLSDATLFLSATPLQLGTPDLFNLLHLLIPEEFPNFFLFHDRIQPNEYINETLRRLHDPPAAVQALERVLSTAHAQRFEKNPYYNEAVRLLKGAKQLSREQAVYLQRELTELNTLSYVFTRTKKRPRTWRGWHHHQTLTILAHHFLVRLRLRLKKTVLTAPQVCLLLSAVLPRRRFDPLAAIALVRRLQRQNYAAYRSHHKRHLRHRRRKC